MPAFLLDHIYECYSRGSVVKTARVRPCIFKGLHLYLSLSLWKGSTESKHVSVIEWMLGPRGDVSDGTGCPGVEEWRGCVQVSSSQRFLPSRVPALKLHMSECTHSVMHSRPCTHRESTGDTLHIHTCWRNIYCCQITVVKPNKTFYD